MSKYHHLKNEIIPLAHLKSLYVVQGRAVLLMPTFYMPTGYVGLSYLFAGDNYRSVHPEMCVMFSQHSEIEINERILSSTPRIATTIAARAAMAPNYCPARKKLIFTLKELQTYYGNQFRVSNKELALLSACSREMVGREYKILQLEGMVAKGAGHTRVITGDLT